ncbi:SusC/RagA family TonB-linked outer membrane protein [Jejudonia soesokkakensis]|uniref:SusC/RagA family TonB-linked outer membrane protein n=1 Tax=Jejudonia soesokkakensis TaxID=1323432 RepID=A0ABW2MV93_9FLAO
MKTKLLLFCFILFCAIVQAQIKTISGTVSDNNGTPLPGVNIVVKGTSNGTQSNIDGQYSLSASIGQTLVFTYLGFVPQEVRVTETSNSINVTMVEDAAQLEEVVVVGYGTTTKRKLTDAISSVDAEDIKEVPNANFQNALVGKLSGVQIQQTNGKAEGSVNFTIRGISSINGTQEPLFVVDGVPVLNNQESGTGAPTNPLINLNANNIESIEILKDASSAAIYGSRGTNGVVIITTKKGKSGKLKVNFNSSYGRSEATNKREFLNAEQYVELFTESRLNSGVAQTSIDNQLDALATDSNGFTNDWRNAEVDTNWTDLALVKGSILENNVSVSGGDENSTFYMSLGSNLTEGIVRGNTLERYNFRINADRSVSEKFKAGANLRIGKSEIDRIASDNLFVTPLQAIAQVPISSPFNQDGTINSNTLYPNFLLEDKFAFYKTNIWNFGGSAFAQYNILPSLSFRSELGYEHFNQLEEEFRGPETDFQGADNGQASNRTIINDFYTSNNFLTFDTSINNSHNINLIGGMSYEYSQRKASLITGIDFANPLITTLAGAATIDGGTSTATQRNLVSFFTRFSYDYQGKYLLKASMRADGSSRFGPNNRYGYFPAASIGWVLSRESFLENSETLSNLKLRASYGQTGNQPLGNFDYVNSVSIGAYGGIPSLTLAGAGDPELKWEITTQYDIGLEFGLFKNRIFGEIDYYVKDTEDLLLDAAIPGTIGIDGSSIFTNIGRVENKGIEFSLTSRNIRSKHFNWSTNFNISHNKNEVISLSDGQEENIIGDQIIRVGESLASFYLVEFAGVDPANGDALYFLNTELPDGSLDRNTTNNFNDAEQVVLGSPYPDIITGLTNTLNYKNLDLSFTFQGQFGASIYNSAGRFQENGFVFEDNPSISQLDRWQQPGDITNVPQLRSDGSNLGGQSSRYLQDSDFVRLRNITLGYNFVDLGPFDSLRVYATGLNLLTFTDYDGYDPEATRDDAGTLNRGTEFYSAPPAKTYTIGINVQF